MKNTNDNQSTTNEVAIERVSEADGKSLLGGPERLSLLLFSTSRFSDASSHLYNRACLSVGPSVRHAFVKNGNQHF